MEQELDLLRLLWTRLAARETALTLQDGRPCRIDYPGEEDPASGTFRAAELTIDGIRRRGDIWFGPELPADRTPYVVLQIVPAPAPSIYLRDGERLPQLVMPAAEEVRRAVASLQTGAAAYECGQWLGELPAARRIGLLDRLLVERLDRKCRDVMRLFDACGGDWSQTLYAMLFRALGGNRNREAYLDLASRATYPMVLRERSSMEQVEALLLGTSGLLEGCFFDDYIRRLNDHFRYLARKYDITPMYAGAWESSRIRAQNRPVTRIVQLAAVVAGCDFLFDRVVGAASREALHRLFDVPVSPYWTTHYVPDGTGNRCPHRIGPEKADLLIINAAVPVMFAFGSRTGKESIKASALELLASLPAENNAITRGWSGTGVPVRSALDSQALIQLRNEYCTPHRCAACRIGRSLIKNRR